ncbi:two-component regulator propeller domain-containing protein [Rufibacter sp. XAAS-G3-1]|uniref:type IX secretion system anionic LPS delivery protein PorZ n=1 Tax=Rufibacter sp. XAAS-G3-1 TaxID=2729134 RepID=UPI0015E75B99|nr:two-component regulator propeller domain-containing protein [Rufibacter sp. XAAS-G3-1]
MTLPRIVRFAVVLSALLGSSGANAQSSQLPLGGWQVHVPNHRAKAVAETPSSVYCATEDGFFRYLKEDHTLQKLSRTNGFSDVNLNTLNYDSVSATLVVAYENTNLDLLKDGKVHNLTELVRKPMTGAKIIHHLYTHNKMAFVSTSFGLVVVDLVKLEIKDTYSNLGAKGEAVQVFSSTVWHDSLYIASSNGVMSANLNNPNLLDFRSWRRFDASQGLPVGISADAVKTISAFEGGVYAGVNGTGVYRFNGTTWSKAGFSTQDHQFRSMETNGKRLLITGAQEVLEVSSTGQASRLLQPLFQNLRMAIPARAGGVWAASYEKGLVQVTNAGAIAHVPNGPAFVDVFGVYAERGLFTVLGGGYSQGYLQRSSPAGFYQYQNGQWTSYNFASGGQFPPNARDLVMARRNPVNGKLYIASYGAGLLEWDNLNQVKLYNNTNSPLLSALDANDRNFIRVPGIAIDAAGSVWVTNRNQFANAPGLFELKPDGTWKSHPFTGYSLGSGLDKVVVDDSGYKWVTISTNGTDAGMVVYDDLTAKYAYIGGAGQGGLPGKQVFALAVDQQGEIWAGTNSGVAVFSSTPEIFTSSYAGAYLPIYERRPLLQGQVIRSIAVDGGNRKWIGTDTGLWLFHETGEEMILHFTTKNSPLPSDKIIDLCVDPSTGEVLIGTEGGIAVFRGTATRTETVNKNCLQVYPNPVRIGFSGNIGISGVPDNGWVKITDVAGFLVFEGKAAGGTFAWHGRDYNGRKAKPGVYIVLASSADGTQTCMTKIAVQ